MPKLDELEVESITDNACTLLRSALRRLPGTPGSPEQREAAFQAARMLFIASAMHRAGFGHPSECGEIAGSLNGRLLHVVEFWEEQYAGR
jgi:hypothetical protein